MRHNRLPARLNAGQPSIGTDRLSSWPMLVELMGDPLTSDLLTSDLLTSDLLTGDLLTGEARQ